MSLEDARDIVVIVYGVLGIFLFLVMIAISFLVYRLIRSMKRNIEALIEDPIRPTLEEFRGTAQNVRNSTEFATEKAVSPIIKVVSIARGVRRGAKVMAGRRPGRR